jgi:bifunctional DNA-binding transcriptional regulator/antitoxin component of YhaV-PrlF toxin-antitoxin module
MMETFTLKVDNQGRISIPAKLRKEAGMDMSTDVLAFLEHGGIVILTRDRALLQAQRMAQTALGKDKRSVVDEFLAGRRREAEREAKEMAGHARCRQCPRGVAGCVDERRQCGGSNDGVDP